MTAAPSPPPARLASLDALRGFDMFCLLVLDGVVRAAARAAPDNRAAQFLLAQFTHPDWEGFTFYDLIFPLFEFLIGASVLLSVTKRLARGESRGRVLRHAVVRAALMWFLGTWVNGNLLTYDPVKFRLTYSVLQMLAVAYLVATLFVLFSGLRGQVVGFVVLLVGYWALQTFVPLPGEPRTYTGWASATVHAPAHQRGVYAEGGVFSFWLDDRLFGPGDQWKVGWVLQSMTHGCTALLGVFAARMVLTYRPFPAAARLAALGAACLAAGWAWGHQFPVIKNLWTSTFVLWAGGWSFLLLAGFHAVIEGAGWRRWAFPFLVVGANSLVAYLLSTVFRPIPAAAAWVLVGGLARHAGDWHPVVVAAGTGLAGWLFLLLLYRTRTFVRL